MQLKLKRLRPAAIAPRYMTPGAAGMDVTSAADGPITLEPLGVPTGWAMKIAAGVRGAGAAAVRPGSKLPVASGGE